MYTGCDRTLLLALDSAYTDNLEELGGNQAHPAFIQRTAKDDKKRFFEVDHIIDVQLFVRAIITTNKCTENDQFVGTLTFNHIEYLRSIINDQENLNVTTRKINAYAKNKLVPKFFGAFRDKVMYKATQFKWLPRPNAPEIVHSVLQPAIRFSKADCLDLPDLLYTTREVALTPQQQTYYDKIKKSMVAQAAGERITAVNAAGLINKLLQISQGVAYTEDREVVEFDVSNRFSELLDVINATPRKVIVFVPFKHALERVEQDLIKAGISVATIHGGTPAGTRAQYIKRFQTEDDPKVIMLIPQAAAHGITLTRADTIVWWGPIASAELYMQGNARAHRAGQKHPVTVVRIQGSAVEKRVYAMLDGKVDLHQGLVELYEQEIA